MDDRDIVVLDPARDLHDQATRLRRLGPVVPVRLPGHPPVKAYALTSHEIIMAVLSDPRFAKNPEHWRAWAAGVIPPDWEYAAWLPPNMLTADGSDHHRLRTLVSRAFTARRIDDLQPLIMIITGRLLDALDLDGGRVIDLKACFARPLPLTVISELFGVPAGTRRQEIEMLCDRVFDQTLTPADAAITRRRLHDALSALVAAKRKQPGDDLTTALITIRDQEDRLSEPELIWTLILMIGAGFETTTNLITNAVRALLANPDQLTSVRQGRCKWPVVVEETLRWDPPIANLPFRFATEDLTVEGTVIPAGEPVLMCYGAAGRDPDYHGLSAHRFDITRAQRGHLAFSYGPHYCLGAPLARLEARIALPALFARFPDLALAVPEEDLLGQPSIIASGLTTLPVTRGEHRPLLPSQQD